MRCLVLFFITLSLYASDIKVALAANVSYAIDELLQEFYKSNHNTKVRVILGSSGKLTAQIKNGAPFDIFMSANMKYPNSLYRDKKALTKPVVYAKGSLALLSVKERDLSSGMEFLKTKDIKKIAVANPKVAPYGKAAIEALKNANLLEKVKQKLVYGQTIAQAVAFAIKATDVGIIAKSALYNPKLSYLKHKRNWVEIDSKLYTPIKQGIIMMKNNKSAKAFYDFILSSKAKEIFKKYGYIVE
jgi:molybdate transport system substrate-binding protein